MRQEQLAETTAVLQGRVGDRKAWVSAVLAANWAAAAKARAALHSALPDSIRDREDPDAALYAEPQVLVHAADEPCEGVEFQPAGWPAALKRGIP